jgi:hypothetical protein
VRNRKSATFCCYDGEQDDKGEHGEVSSADALLLSKKASRAAASEEAYALHKTELLEMTASLHTMS